MNLELPGTGYGPYWRPTPRRVELFADWIEAQVLRADFALAKPQLVDRLEGTGLVKDSDDSWALIEDAFSACLRRFQALAGSYPFVLSADTIEPSGGECVAYRFCLLSSLPEQFTVLRSSYPSEFRDLFEALVAHALRAILPGWEVYETGWSNISAEGKSAIVQRIATWTHGKYIDASVFPNANDAQVDVAVVRHFRDGRSAVPVLLGQCATGVTDWKKKLSRPNLDRWAKAVQFSAQPVRLFAVPFALDADSFWEAITESNGLVLDRIRVCGDAGSLTDGLAAGLRAWLSAAEVLVPEAA